MRNLLKNASFWYVVGTVAAVVNFITGPDEWFFFGCFLCTLVSVAALAALYDTAQKELKNFKEFQVFLRLISHERIH